MRTWDLRGARPAFPPDVRSGCTQKRRAPPSSQQICLPPRLRMVGPPPPAQDFSRATWQSRIFLAWIMPCQLWLILIGAALAGGNRAEAYESVRADQFAATVGRFSRRFLRNSGGPWAMCPSWHLAAFSVSPCRQAAS